MELNEFLTSLNTKMVAYAPKIAGAIITLIIGWLIIKMIVGFLDGRMKKRKVDASLRPFLRSLLGTLLKVLLIITVVSMLGVQMTSFVAVLGAAGLAIGLALQGSLANFAGGVLILLFKPYKVGDMIDAQGFLGIVHEIQIFNTVLKTTDNKVVIIPNGGLSNGAITNLTMEKTRRVDMTFGIGYGDDIPKARLVLSELIKKNKKILKDPSPDILVSELADSSVNFAVRVWVKTEDYWAVYFDMHEKVKLNFDKNKISIPFPQRDVHIFNN